MSRNKLVVAVALALALTGSVPVLARGETNEVERESVRDRIEQTVQSTDDTVKSTVQTVNDGAEDKLGSRQERIDAKKAEIQQKLDAKASERKVKLEGRRLAQCQNRQANINALLNKSLNVGQAKLERIQNFEAAIIKFYEEKELSSDAYEAAKADSAAKGVSATAALESIQTTTFECTDVDAGKPSDTIKTAHEMKRNALKEYRDSVQELLKVVREAFAAKAGAEDEA